MLWVLSIFCILQRYKHFKDTEEVPVDGPQAGLIPRDHPVRLTAVQNYIACVKYLNATFFYQLFYGYCATHKSQSNSVKRCNFERCHCQYQLPNGLFRNFVPHFLIYYFSLSRLYCIRSIEIWIFWLISVYQLFSASSWIVTSTKIQHYFACLHVSVFFFNNFQNTQDY